MCLRSLNSVNTRKRFRRSNSSEELFTNREKTSQRSILQSLLKIKERVRKKWHSRNQINFRKRRLQLYQLSRKLPSSMIEWNKFHWVKSLTSLNPNKKSVIVKQRQIKLKIRSKVKFRRRQAMSNRPILIQTCLWIS